MNLRGVLRTGISGMNAPSAKPRTIADEAASAEFSKLILESSANAESSDTMATSVRDAITQGSLAHEKSLADFGIRGGGNVPDPNGDAVFVRTGTFVTDGTTDTLFEGNGWAPRCRRFNRRAERHWRQEREGSAADRGRTCATARQPARG